MKRDIKLSDAVALLEDLTESNPQAWGSSPFGHANYFNGLL